MPSELFNRRRVLEKKRCAPHLQSDYRSHFEYTWIPLDFTSRIDSIHKCELNMLQLRLLTV